MTLQVVPNLENQLDISITSPHLGGTGVRLATPDSREAGLFAPVLSLLHVYEAAVAKAADDPALTAEGKTVNVAKPLSELLAAIETVQTQLSAEAEQQTAFVATLFTPPAIDPAAIPLDVETRRLYLSLDRRTRESLDGTMLDGNNDDLLNALSRCPVAAAIPPSIVAIRQHRVEQRHGPRLAALAAIAEDSNRVLSGLAAIRGMVTRRSPFSQ